MFFAALSRIPLWFWVALAVAAATMGALWVIYDTGYHRGAVAVQAKWDTERAATATIIANEKARQAEVVVRTVIEYRDRVQIVKEKGEEVIREIPLLVRADCKLNGGFRVLHDAAAGAQPLPADPAAAAAAADPVEAVALLRTAAENYASCQADFIKLEALQKIVFESMRAPAALPSPGPRRDE
jgi:hypothetical protein